GVPVHAHADAAVVVRARARGDPRATREGALEGVGDALLPRQDPGRGLAAAGAPREGHRSRVTMPMRFATQAGGAPSGQDWIDRAKRLEALGYDTLAMPDHMIGGAWA